eukprot:TRINITY_DN96574_c0_g1_i1.p2 TRINITY_DN96574_c0_g1~~TRINITY_DN96574_c0_g1_i1.p2  ORF type:complete len:160 (-),score=33.56 TRINITY_DN96574_c0_g1_i1:413-892(-)
MAARRPPCQAGVALLLLCWSFAQMDLPSAADSNFVATRILPAPAKPLSPSGIQHFKLSKLGGRTTPQRPQKYFSLTAAAAAALGATVFCAAFGASQSMAGRASNSRTPRRFFFGGDDDAKEKVTGGSIYDFTVKNIDGADVPLSQYNGKVVLIVNVASK